MAEYTNLASLKGLKAGDVVKYTKTMSIDFCGKILEIELFGCYGNTAPLPPGFYYISDVGYGAAGKGGYAKFNITTHNLRDTFHFDSENGTILSYNDYPIAIAGDGGSSGAINSVFEDTGIIVDAGSYDSETCSNGGGEVAGNGSTNWMDYYKTYATGGSQTSAGKGAPAWTGGSSNDLATAGKDGTVGIGGNYNSPYFEYSGSTIINGIGGSGWYGGGSGSISISIHSGEGCITTGGGGSGMIFSNELWATNQTRFSNLDTDVAVELANSITSRYLESGKVAGLAQSSRMIVTILHSGDDNEPTLSVGYYHNNELKNVVFQYYNGNEFVPCQVCYYDGTDLRYLDSGGN